MRGMQKPFNSDESLATADRIIERGGSLAPRIRELTFRTPKNRYGSLKDHSGIVVRISGKNTQNKSMSLSIDDMVKIIATSRTTHIMKIAGLDEKNEALKKNMFIKISRDIKAEIDNGELSMTDILKLLRRGSTSKRNPSKPSIRAIAAK